MKETRFIAQNKEKWLESESLLKNPVKDPEKLSNLFTQIVDDLSYSRTYYPNRSVRVYLNKIARQYFSIIYSHNKEKKNRFSLFWLEELPQIIIYSKKQLLISLIVFLLSVAIGVFSSVHDPKFTSTILGDDYVTMTNTNIENGDPMAVYKKQHQVDMFLGITLNNLIVAFRTYVFGIFLAIGTLAIMLYNGIMVGCFQFFFIERGLFLESAVSIWLHGTLEISSIIIAGGAGLTLGSGLIFPGTYSRLQAFQISAIRSLKLMLGIAPIIVVAAIIESFLTRYTDLPDVLKFILILLSAIFIIGYFVVYPWWKSKTGFEVPLKEMRLPPNPQHAINYTRIKNNDEIIKDTFTLYGRHSTKLLRWIVVVALGSTIASYFLERDSFSPIAEDNWFIEVLGAMVFALRTPSPLFILINTMCTSAILYVTFSIVDREAKKTPPTFNFQTYIQVVVLTACMYAAIYLEFLGILFLLAAFGTILVSAFTQLTEKCTVWYGIAKTWELVQPNTKLLIELQAIILLLSFSFLLVLSAPLIYIYTSILQWNFAETDVWSKNIIQFIEMFIKTVSFYLILPILSMAMSNLYFTLEEISSARYLKESIARAGIRPSKHVRR